MGTLQRTETLTHRIGTNGKLSVKAVSGLLRIRGIDGDEAKLTIGYRIRATDQAAAERALESGRVFIVRGPGTLDIETPERRLATGLAWLLGGARVTADVGIDIPWGTSVTVETVSGAIEASSLTGDQRYRTLSGDLRFWALAGLLDAGTVSGMISLDTSGNIRMRASTISGAVRARARTFLSAVVSTTSGGISLSGDLDPSGDHRAESISGGVELITNSGVTADLRTISGSIRTDIQHRLEGSRGSWRAIVGDGRAHLIFNSTSGSLRIVAPPPGDTVQAPSGPASTSAASGPEPAWDQPVAAAASSGSSDAAADAEHSGGDAEGASETWSAEEAPDPAATSGEAGASDEELTVLQALERGEIGVDEAADRLERAGR